MTNYIILAVFVVLVFSHFICFMTGLKKGRKAAEAEYNEEKLLREKSARDFERAKEEIKGEVLHDAAQQKAGLNKHINARDRFDAINNSLSNKP